jgi:hypothetical protein
MDDLNKAKLAAAGKIALGGARVFSSVATATGHGVLGTYLRNHNMTAVAARIATSSMKGGLKLIDEGLADWKLLNQ